MGWSRRGFLRAAAGVSAGALGMVGFAKAEPSSLFDTSPTPMRGELNLFVGGITWVDSERDEIMPLPQWEFRDGRWWLRYDFPSGAR